MLFYLLSVLGLVHTFQKTKCKRLLNTTMERIKLLGKCREARLRQLHRDVIELLQRGKKHKVQPWLQRISKELYLFSGYIKIAEYCEFVQINLKDIAGQRECPTGLEEPLAGLCFAASCCADLPELQELREIFAMKYGKLVVNSAQDLQPNCHVNQQFLEFLCAKDASETREEELLEAIITQYNVKQSHEQDTQQQEIHDAINTEGSVDATNECNQLQEGIDDTLKALEVKDQSEDEVLQEVDVVQESNHIGRVCEEDLGSMELATELSNRKRTLEDRETCRSAFKRAYRRTKFWLNKTMEGEENGGEEHEKTADKGHDCVDEDGQGDVVCSDTRRLANVHHDGCEGCGASQGEGITTHMNEDVSPNEDQCILYYAEQPSLSQPPQRPPPPPPPPKRVPPPLPSFRVVSMPSSYNDKQGIANTSLPLGCSTMANNYYGSHVHPRLPKYEDLVANFTALKQR